MRQTIASTLRWLASKFDKSAPHALTGGQWSGTSYTDAFKRNRQPTPNELMAELKNTAWTCASINSSVCATYPPQLYVVTERRHPRPKCLTKQLGPGVEKRLRGLTRLPQYVRKADTIEEVVEHPLIDLLQMANDMHNSFDLWELTTLYQEVHGSAYWWLQPGPLGVPETIWVLPSQNVTPKRNPDSPNIIDYYLYRTGAKEQRFPVSQVIHFRYPDPRDPYTAGLSPLRACWESVALSSDYLALKSAKFENNAIPDAIISPTEVMGEEERDRLESQWNTKFRRGGQGRVAVAESPMEVKILSHSMGDLAALAEMGKTKEDIANAFHVPISFFTTNTNLANLLASQTQHMSLAIDPRLARRDEKLNSQLVPLFDPSGRLFLASEDPVPVDKALSISQKDLDMKYGIVTINEVRSERGLPPVPWGNTPWLPINQAPTDFVPDRSLVAPRRGRNYDPGKVGEGR